MDMSGLSNHSSFGSEPFLTLEPPLSDSDYIFSLGDGEGLTDLFDFQFWEGTEADLQCQLCWNDEMKAVLFWLDNRYKYWGNAAPSVTVAMSSDGACGWGMNDFHVCEMCMPCLKQPNDLVSLSFMWGGRNSEHLPQFHCLCLFII